MFEFTGLPDWVIWYLVANYAGLGVFGLYMLYQTRLKIGNKAVFVRKASESEKDVGEYVVVGEKEFSRTAQSVEYKDKSFVVNLAYAGYRNRGITSFFFDFDKGSALRFGGELVGVDADLVDLFTGGSFIAHLVQGVKGLDRNTLMLFLITLGCAVFGAFAGGYLLHSANITWSG